MAITKVSASLVDLDGGVVINESSADADFRVESNGNANMLFVDGGNDYVSIGASTDLSGALNITHGSEFGLVTSGGYNYQAKFESTDAEAAIVIEDSNSGTDYNRIGVITNDMTFITNNSERMRIDSSGMLLVNTTSSWGGETTPHIESRGDVAGDYTGLIVSNTNDAAGDSVSVNFGLARDGGLVFGNAGKITVGKEQDWTTTASTVDGFMSFSTMQNESLTERMRIDSSGNVGIGQTSPYSHASFSSLSLGGTSGKGGLIQIKHSDDAAKGYLYAQSDAITLESVDTNIVRFVSGAAERMRIDSSGNVGIGTSSPTTNLTIGGTSSTARVIPATDNVGYIGESTHRWQAIYAVNGSIQTSDEREKTEIKETNLGLDFIKDLKPVSYKWIDGEQQNKGKDEREHQGLIAQQVAETVEKHGIDKNTFGGLDIQKTEKYDDFHGMSYDQFVAPLIKAIQELSAEVEELKTKLENK